MKCDNFEDISHYEYLVRIPVQSAYHQELFVQGVQYVLYKLCDVYCAWCAMYILQGVQCELYKVCSVYCTRYAVYCQI